MDILIEVGAHETEKLEELISSTKMTHEECFGGEIEKSFSENILKLTCKKCGMSHQVDLTPGAEDTGNQKKRTGLINFLLNPTNWHFSFFCQGTNEVELIYPKSREQFINYLEKKKSQKLIFLLGTFTGFVIIAYLLFSVIFQLATNQSLLGGIIYVLCACAAIGGLFFYLIIASFIYDYIYEN